MDGCTIRFGRRFKKVDLPSLFWGPDSVSITLSFQNATNLTSFHCFSCVHFIRLEG